MTATPTTPEAATPEDLVAVVGQFLATLFAWDRPIPPELVQATFGLHSRVDRAVSDYIGEVSRTSSATSIVQADPYTILLVKAAMTWRARMNPVEVAAGSRPFRPTFELVEDMLLKPMFKIATSDIPVAEREDRAGQLLAHWIADLTDPDEDEVDR